MRSQAATSCTPTAVPGAQPWTPVLVVAMGRQVLRVSGELADGILPHVAMAPLLCTMRFPPSDRPIVSGRLL